MSDDRIRRSLDEAIALGEVGVQVAAYLGDELIVDEVAGVADAATGTAVTPTTLFPSFSVGKAVVATAVHLQAERGFLELDTPIARYWPEFGQKGKDGITVRHVLTHRGGIPQVPRDLAVEQLQSWDHLIRFLEEQEPLCAPGIRSMYHTITFGHILGELVRRTDPAGRRFPEYVQEEINAPLGIEDLWYGLPEECEDRVATLTLGAHADGEVAQLGPAMNPIRAASIGMIRFDPETFNRRLTHSVVLPAAGVIMNARSGARFFSLLATGGLAGGRRLLSRETLLEFTQPRSNSMEIDEALGQPSPVGMGGYHVDDGKSAVIGRSPHMLAHGGAGGSAGWADLDTGLSAAITHNRMFGAVDPDRHPFKAIGEAIRAVAADRALATG